MTLTGVGWYFSAAHTDERGVVHGHTWEVVAWFAAGSDAVKLQERLKSVVAQFDHCLLKYKSTEDLAADILSQLDCIAVDVSRPIERLYARVQR